MKYYNQQITRILPITTQLRETFRGCRNCNPMKSMDTKLHVFILADESVTKVELCQSCSEAALEGKPVPENSANIFDF